MQDPSMSPAERLNSELDLLRAMYPEQVHWVTQSRELKFVHDGGGDLVLRLPDSYLEDGLPSLIGATTAQKQDLRSEMKRSLEDLNLHAGEEVLDTIVQCYQDLVANSGSISQTSDNINASNGPHKVSPDEGFKTVIIWLHHLLATGKRKLALDPTLSSETAASRLSGITKPGYPGVMLFSGPCSLVDAHVTELKNQRWQAFQVRLEEQYDQAEAWKFLHGNDIIELESMSDVVQDIVGKDKQEMFLKAIGVK